MNKKTKESKLRATQATLPPTPQGADARLPVTCSFLCPPLLLPYSSQLWPNLQTLTLRYPKAFSPQQDKHHGDFVVVFLTSIPNPKPQK